MYDNLLTFLSISLLIIFLLFFNKWYLLSASSIISCYFLTNAIFSLEGWISSHWWQLWWGFFPIRMGFILWIMIIIKYTRADMAQRPSLENVKKRICREVRTNHSVNNRVERSSRDVSVTEREARYGSTDNIRVVAGVYVFCMQCVVYMRSFPGTCHITCKTRNAFKTLLATVLKSAYFYMCILTLNFSYKIKFPIYLQIPLFTAEFHHPFIVNIPNRLNFIYTDQDIPGFSS